MFREAASRAASFNHWQPTPPEQRWWLREWLLQPAAKRQRWVWLDGHLLGGEGTSEEAAIAAALARLRFPLSEPLPQIAPTREALNAPRFHCPVDSAPCTPVLAQWRSAFGAWEALCGRHLVYHVCPDCLGAIDGALYQMN